MNPPVVFAPCARLLPPPLHGQLHDRLSPVRAVLDDLLQDGDEPFEPGDHKESLGHHEQHEALVVELEVAFFLGLCVRRAADSPRTLACSKRHPFEIRQPLKWRGNFNRRRTFDRLPVIAAPPSRRNDDTANAHGDGPHWWYAKKAWQNLLVERS